MGLKVTLVQRADRLMNAQLDEQARRFFSDRSRNRWNASAGRAEVSKIFDWYKEDFGGDSSVLAFIKKVRKGKSDFKSVSYQEYDWGLNEVK